MRRQRVVRLHQMSIATHDATLGACVLVPAVLRDALLYAAPAGLYRPRWSDMTLAEVERTLLTQGMATAEQAATLIARMQTHFPEARVVGHERQIALMTNHPKDRHLLAAAVTAGAATIVTSNLRDFPAAALEPHGIEARSPDAFLSALYDREPGLVVRLVRQQAASLTRPPRPFAYVLERLSRHTPQFVERIRHATQGDEPG
jgi:hypothetical protein